MNKKAFTLAETLITLTILGVVAAITVPSLINRQIEASNRTKVKKAMAVYEKALNQMIIDQDIKGGIGTALNGDDCSKTTEYFKKVETTASDCRFKTADRVWWDITDIEHPVISLKDKITTAEESAAIKAKADSIEKDKTSFVMVGEIKDSIVRINDKGATTATPDKDYLGKLYGFMNNDIPSHIENDCQTSFICNSGTCTVIDCNGKVVRKGFGCSNEATEITDCNYRSFVLDGDDIYYTQAVRSCNLCVDPTDALDSSGAYQFTVTLKSGQIITAYNCFDEDSEEIPLGAGTDPTNCVSCMDDNDLTPLDCPWK